MVRLFAACWVILVSAIAVAAEPRDPFWQQVPSLCEEAQRDILRALHEPDTRPHQLASLQQLIGDDYLPLTHRSLSFKVSVLWDEDLTGALSHNPGLSFWLSQQKRVMASVDLSSSTILVLPERHPRSSLELFNSLAHESVHAYFAEVISRQRTKRANSVEEVLSYHLAAKATDRRYRGTSYLVPWPDVLGAVHDREAASLAVRRLKAGLAHELILVLRCGDSAVDLWYERLMARGE